MADAAISSALSGLHAATKRVQGAASNIANAGDLSRVKPKDGEPVFQPIQTVQSPVPGGGVMAHFQPLDPSTVTVYQPDSPLADANGLVNAPNVDLEQQLLDLLGAEQAYKANLKTIETAAQMDKDILKLDI